MTIVDWIGPPAFWAEGKIIVLYIGKDEAMRELVSEILGAPVAQADISRPRGFDASCI